MKKQVAFAIIASIFFLIGCTGCENEVNEIGEIVDLTYETGVLTSSRWVKETTAEDPEFMAFDVVSLAPTQFSMAIYHAEDDTMNKDMGIITIIPDESAICRFGDAQYVLKISSTAAGLITLTLKDEEAGITLFFAPEVIS